LKGILKAVYQFFAVLLARFYWNWEATRIEYLYVVAKYPRNCSGLLGVALLLANGAWRGTRGAATESHLMAHMEL
jgi:hypothetical protein